jgi:hypothetical protein
MSHKTFYTERDIEDLAHRGVQTLEVNDDIYLTDLARERAERLGVKLVREHDTPPSAPIRPYISAEAAKPQKEQTPASDRKDEMFNQVRTAVIKRLGDDVDPLLLDTIIRRVLDNI